VRALYERSPADHLLLLEHEPVYTMGIRADPAHVLVDPASVGASLVHTDRGGDVTYHGPGQLTGYPILQLLHGRSGGMADTVAYVRSVEQLLIDTLRSLGLANAGRLDRYPGVWIDPDSANARKIAAIGVKLSRGRTMHGFALNVDTDLTMFRHIVPCGIADKAVTSLRAEGCDATMRDVVEIVSELASQRWGSDEPVDRADVAWRIAADGRDLSAFSRREGPGEPVRVGRGTSVRIAGRLADAGVTEGLSIASRKPEWMRAKVHHGPEVLALKRTLRELSLVTVCEEAGCPNLSECWADGTATFMINGERCTRACGFCLVDTRHPLAIDVDEPAHVADAVARLGLKYAVVTAVARDDLDDGGASAFAATVHAIRAHVPECQVEVLIPDCKGDEAALDLIFAARPDVLNHNIETVARLQRAVRPSAAYARSLAVLARAKSAGLTTKSGMIVGMGESDEELRGALTDLRGVGVDIVTIGQYLRPTTNHLPVARWVTPEQFSEYRRFGEEIGIAHVESSPFTRSSYHARESNDRVRVGVDRPGVLR